MLPWRQPETQPLLGGLNMSATLGTHGAPPSPNDGGEAGGAAVSPPAAR